MLIVIEELDPGLFQRARDFCQRFRPRAYRPIEAFHALYGPDGNPRFLRQLRLLPSEECASRLQLPAGDDDQ